MTVPARTRRAVTAALAAGLLAGITACAPPPPPPPTQVQLTLRADGGINPDPSGRASPAQIHVYWLRGAQDFQNADFFALTGQPSAALGQELAQHEVVTMRPNQQQTMMKSPDPGVTHVGVVTAYRSLDGVNWRAVGGFPSNQTTGFNVLLGANGVTMGLQGPSAAVPGPAPALAAR